MPQVSVFTVRVLRFLSYITAIVSSVFRFLLFVGDLYFLSVWDGRQTSLVGNAILFRDDYSCEK